MRAAASLALVLVSFVLFATDCTGNVGGTSDDRLPCDVAAMVSAKCSACHGTPLAGSAPMRLQTLADFTARSTVDDTVSVAQRALTRMQSAAAPMPPASSPPVTADELAAFQAWVNGGTPSGTCTVGAGGDGGVQPPPKGVDADGGLPCSVADVLSQYCVACHGTPPANPAPMSLTTRAELLAPSRSDPARDFAHVSLGRMTDPALPMPPSGWPAPSASEVAAFSDWLTAGEPEGTCAAPKTNDGGTPGAGPPVLTCESGRYQPQPVFGDAHGGPTMAPGLACISCHLGGNFAGQNPGGLVADPDTVYEVMGTAYPAAHEKDLCSPYVNPDAGTHVEIYDRTGALAIRAVVNPGGNFYGSALGGLKLPYTAKIVNANGTRSMTTTQTSGDCNSCHTAVGLNGAPGRIVLP